jgi:hypothetical protein
LLLVASVSGPTIGADEPAPCPRDGRDVVRARGHARAVRRVTCLCPLCQAEGRIVLLGAELAQIDGLLVVDHLEGCGHADGFGDPEILTLAEEWRLITAALDAAKRISGG